MRAQQRARRSEVDHGARLIVPVTDRGDAIGLLEMTLPRYPSPGEVADISQCRARTRLRRDRRPAPHRLFEWGQRSTPFALAAEIQRRLLPLSYTCEAGQFTLAGWLEPASSVGGDTFDYSLDRGALQVSISDAVGHQVEAALLATLLVGSLRNARRKGLDLAEQARLRQRRDGRERRIGPVRHRSAACASTCAPARRRSSTPGTRSRSASATAGSRRSSLARRDALRCRAPARTSNVQAFPFEAGDRIMLLTDGMQERNAAALDVADGAGRPPTPCTRARSSTSSVTRSSTPPAATSATTPPWCVSTGTAGRRAVASPSKAPTSIVPDP